MQVSGFVEDVGVEEVVFDLVGEDEDYYYENYFEVGVWEGQCQQQCGCGFDDWFKVRYDVEGVGQKVDGCCIWNINDGQVELYEDVDESGDQQLVVYVIVYCCVDEVVEFEDFWLLGMRKGLQQ